jgi:hypothetical protein
MKNCAACGLPKPDDAIRCPSCQHADEHVMRAMASGTPGLTLLVLGLLVLWIYRFWTLGWTALPGNLRVLALAAAGLGAAGILFGPMWTFGVRSRKKAAVLFVVAAIAFLFFNFV